MKIGIHLIAFFTTFLISLALNFALHSRPRNLEPSTVQPRDRSFTVNDVRTKLHRHIKSKTFSNMKVAAQDTSGTVAFFYVDETGKRLAVIDWDVWVDGRHHVLAIDRDNYDRSVLEE